MTNTYYQVPPYETFFRLLLLLLLSGYLLGWFFNPETAGDMILINVGLFSKQQEALVPRR
jgi:hypothetical protein